MASLTNLVWLPVRYLLVLVGGLADLFGLLWLLTPALAKGAGTPAERALVRATTPLGLRRVFGVLRVFWSNLVLERRLVSAYDNAGTVVVTRFADVIEVLEREQDFAVVYEPRMRQITDGQNFFLGMQDSPAYQRDVSTMRLAARWEDVDQIIRPFITEHAENVVAANPDRIDVPTQLTLPVVARMVGRYFGTPGPSEQDLIDWTTLMFWYLFADLGADPDLERSALAAAKACREYLDDTIAARKANPTDTDDVLNRCLDLQRAGSLGFDDLAIRNNLIGLIIGAVPTISKAVVHALDQLLDRPQALASAREAARLDDDDILGRHCFEALRFNPVNPMIYRRATHDCKIAAGTLRARRVPRNSLVFAANLSAMFDPWVVEQPGRFRTDRPWQHYLLWGYGLHTCFGRHINRAAIPALLRPLLCRGPIQRADGPQGQIDGNGSPFPAHFVVTLGQR